MHAQVRKRAWGVQGGVHAFARLHTQKDSRPPTVAKLARRLKPGRSNASRRVHSAKMLISSGIWRTISENPCQKISKYSPNLTKYKHTKRVRVQSKQGNTSPSPQNDQIGPEGGRVYIPPKTSARLHAFYAYQGVEDDGAQRPRKIARGGPARTQAPRRHRRRGRQRLPAPRTRRARNLRPSRPDEEGSTQ